MKKHTVITLILFVLTASLYAPLHSITIKSLIEPGNLVFDVGAHKGMKTDIYISKGAHVICFEPQPLLIKFLQEKYRNNPNIQIEGKALGDHNKTKLMYICSQADTISTLSEKWHHGRFQNYTWDKIAPVEIVTLDQMISKYGLPQFCKIDVEGYEYQVLAGLSQPIRHISFEFTTEFISDTEKSIAHLKQLGYHNFNIAIGENEELLFPMWVSDDVIINYIKNSPNPELWGDIYAHYQ